MRVYFVAFALVSEALCGTTSPPGHACGEFEVHMKCKTICPPPFCNATDFTILGECNPKQKCIEGCDCIEGYLRDDNGNCVPKDKCPSPSTTIQCGEFEEQTACADDYVGASDIANEKCADMDKCHPGCKCIDKYVRDSNGACVPTPPDLPCGINEEPSTCKKFCPPQSCDWNPEKMACKDGPCQPGCNCILDYVRDELDNCIPKEQCPADGDEKNQETSPVPYSNSSSFVPSSQYATSTSSVISTVPCKPEPSGETPCIYDECTPTCSNPNPTKCPQISDPTTNRCNCAKGYILSAEGGQCVKVEECKNLLSCNGDRNATFTKCANRCKSTCRNPNGVCREDCGPPGCECKPLYTLSDEGKCILPDDCPGGNPCKGNQTFVYCKFGCPTEYCPENDDLGIIACDPPLYCPPGCGCQRYHRRVSWTDDRCILASDCPPVKCTRQHEVWDPYAGPCFSDRCSDLNRTAQKCYASDSDSQPKCVCEENYRRNSSEVCVPISECSAE